MGEMVYTIHEGLYKLWHFILATLKSECQMQTGKKKLHCKQLLQEKYNV